MMSTNLRVTLSTMLVATAAAGACVISAGAPIEALQPMAFLAGHCWKGDFADGKQSDEHCFSWLYDGKALRDTHKVRAPGRPDYVGETTYYWDSAAKRVEYIYIENLGGISRGSDSPSPTTPATNIPTASRSSRCPASWMAAADRATTP